jgi:hypothetical protein
MDEIKLPQHVVNRIERRWTARFAQAEDWQRPERTPCYRPHKSYDPLQSLQVRRLTEGSLRPLTFSAIGDAPKYGSDSSSNSSRAPIICAL